MNLLGGVTSIKMKMSIVIVVAIAVAAVMSQVAARAGWPPWLGLAVASLLSLVMVQILARGMTRPLRELESAVSLMQRGDYRQRVATESVDEVGRLSDAFNAMSAELAKTERERKDLLMNVSHELRTPLAALRAQLENMTDGVTEPTPDQLDASLAQSIRLEQLIARTMHLARLESGQADFVMSPVSAASLIENAIDAVGSAASNAEFFVSCPDDIKVEVDEQLMMQVLTNLLENAVRFGGDAPVEVEARQADDRVTIEVRDHGPGVSAVETSRIFERFYRADAARSRSSGGAGLGLAIARGIVELHGGTIAAEANHPHGLRVILQL